MWGYRYYIGAAVFSWLLGIFFIEVFGMSTEWFQFIFILSSLFLFWYRDDVELFFKVIAEFIAWEIRNFFR